MIITQQKPLKEILQALRDYRKIFLIGCGECATACKTGGIAELAKLQKDLEINGKIVLGTAIPDAPCLASEIKTAFAKNIRALKDAEAILVLACGSGVQSVKDNDRIGLEVMPGCDTVFGAVMDAKGDFYEKCLMCGECVLDETGGICPLTLCPKGLLNGPCGGVDKGKCEVDKECDCAWILIYKELEKRKRLSEFKKIKPPKDFKKMTRPRKLIMSFPNESKT